MTEDQKYPLHWPSGWKRTLLPKRSRFKTNFSKARREVFEELRRLKAKDAILSTNIPLKSNGEPYATYRLADMGVAIYFKHKGKHMVFACDKFDRIEDNLWAVVQTIKAIRSIERWGASEMMERAFTGFQALPDPNAEDWKHVLNLSSKPTLEEAKSAYQRLAKEFHADHGGSHEKMVRINKAWEQAQKELRA